jgi:hypothetical protein
MTAATSSIKLPHTLGKASPETLREVVITAGETSPGV